MSYTYNIPDHINGDTLTNGISFEILVNATPFNLTNATIEMQLREKKESEKYALRLVTGSGITIIDAVGGEFKIDEQVIIVEKPGTYYYDIQIKTATKTKTYITGTWKILYDVTRG